jgi:hypothetical protein
VWQVAIMENTKAKKTSRKQIEEAAERISSGSKKPLFITRPQLAERWQVSCESCKRYERRGIIRPVKIAARMLRYRLDEIEALEREATLDRKEVTA